MSAAATLLVCALTLWARCAQGAGAPASDCHARIILTLAQAMRPPPDETWVQNLAAANGVQLRYVRALTPTVYLLSMIAATSAGGCDAALERLRHDVRLRAAQIDQRRTPEPG